MPTAKGVRERARAEITSEIVRAGRDQLATDGAAALSLRAVARELGMVSSAVYRYVASRDELLTLLIIEAYDALGAAVEEEAAPSTGTFSGRSVPGRRSRRRAVGGGQPAPVRLALRLAGPGLRGAAGHDRPGVTRHAGARRDRRRCSPRGRAATATGPAIAPRWVAPGLRCGPRGGGQRPPRRRARGDDRGGPQLFGMRRRSSCSARPATSSSTTPPCSTPRWRRWWR